MKREESMIYFMNALKRISVAAAFVLSGLAGHAFAADTGILDKLNAQYLNTVDTCEDGSPAFYCSGVMVRATPNNDERFNADPTDNAAFSYYRKDIAPSSALGFYGANGFIFKPQAEAIATGLAVNYQCSFPYDGATNERPASTLGPHCGTELTYRDGSTIFYDSCKDAGVTDVDSFVAFMEQPNLDMNELGLKQCAFDSNDPDDFALSVQSYAAGPAKGAWSETDLDAWVNGKKLPLDAFFYLVDHDSSRTIALSDRDLYNSEFGVYLPVVGIDLDKPDAPFVIEE
ncbi:hypothetical protein MUA04_23970 [Enterobacteriaceae bacterium H11S18]|uniref:hypothetical protein n=1 Tax=Dryocola clanedunensis TaxID=2925396 RepID=UPI0022F0B3D9|nr:hypothetical protein [Dryocola clanedunensis]MCT4713232.1 hypothetical protein [Dryocola clanedunensis]